MIGKPAICSKGKNRKSKLRNGEMIILKIENAIGFSYCGRKNKFRTKDRM